MTKIIIASNNNGKIIEVKQMLKDKDIELLSMKEAGVNIDIDENGNGYVLVGRNPVTLKNGRILNLGILSTSSISPSFFMIKLIIVIL